jgi:hypothetical protein
MHSLYVNRCTGARTSFIVTEALCIVQQKSYAAQLLRTVMANFVDVVTQCQASAMLAHVHALSTVLLTDISYGVISHYMVLI